MTDWIEHNGGPQPVADDVWVEVNSNLGALRGLAGWFPLSWEERGRYRILNQHLIDAARLEGIRLGLEAAEQTIGDARWRWSTWDDHVRMAKWAESVQTVYKHCQSLIRDLTPDTIAKEAQHD